MLISTKKNYFITFVLKYLLICFLLIIVISSDSIILKSEEIDLLSMELEVLTKNGIPLENVAVFKDYRFYGLTNKEGIIKIKFDKRLTYSYPSNLTFKKSGYKTFSIDFPEILHKRVKIFLEYNSNFQEKEKTLTGKLTIGRNLKPLKKKEVFIIGDCNLRRIWTDKKGNFYTNIPESKFYLFVYFEKIDKNNNKNSNIKNIDKFNIYIEYIENNDIKNRKLYINFFNFDSKNYSLNNINKVLNGIFSINFIIANNNYERSIQFPFKVSSLKNNLQLIVNSSNDKIFNKFNFKINLNIINDFKLKEKTYKIMLKYKIKLNDRKVLDLLNYQKKIEKIKNNFRKLLITLNSEVIEKKDNPPDYFFNFEFLKHDLKSEIFYYFKYSFLDKNFKNIFTYFTYRTNFNIFSGFLNNAKFIDIEIIYPLYIDYLYSLIDPLFNHIEIVFIYELLIKLK